MQDIMLDLETLGTNNNAVILAIGAIKFDPIAGEFGEQFYANVEPTSAQRLGLQIDASTVMWWLQQSEDARKSLFNNQMSLESALRGFYNFCTPGSRVWGNGPAFDCVILRSAFEAANIPVPWHYSGDRDVRTIRGLIEGFWGDIDLNLGDRGVPHNALDDAIFQAKYVIQAYRVLRGSINEQ